MYQLRKSRIEIKVNLIAHANTCETAKLMADNWYNKTINIMNNSNDKSNNDYANIDLTKFGIYTKIFLTNGIREIYYK